MLNRILTLKIIEWLLLILSVMNVGSAVLAIGGQGAVAAGTPATLATLAVVQIVLNTFIAVGVLAMMSQKRWGFWFVASLLLVGAVLSTFPPAKWFGVFLSLTFLVLLAFHWRTFVGLTTPAAPSTPTKSSQ